MKTPVFTKAINSNGLDGLLRASLQYSVYALLGVIALSTSTHAQPSLVAPFTRITNSVFDQNSAQSLVAAWGDYDNDGWLDIFVANQPPGAQNWLFRSNRDGTFSRVTSVPVTSDVAANVWGAAWADYDNDGWLDLIVGSQDGSTPNRLYHNLSGSFVSPSEAEIGSLATDAPQTLGLTWADYDNDGYLDLFVANGTLGGTYQDFLYHNEGDGSFRRVSDPDNPIVTTVFSSSIGSWSDYDNDGDMDLLVTHTGGVRNELFRNDGMGQFVEVSIASGLTDVGESVGVAWGDYDNDGDLDLFVTNVRLIGAVIQNFFYENKGDGTFERVTTGELTQEQDHFVSCAWVDYDNDGWLDLFLTVTGQVLPAQQGGVLNRLYRNQGNGTFVKVSQGRLVTDQRYAGACAWGDYDNDGFPDVLVTFGTIYAPDHSALYRNNGNANSWIKIKCVGTMSNRSAIGTKIRALANIGGTNRWQMRQIVGNEGWIGFNSLDAVIGLGNATNIDTLRIEWPSGIVQEFHNVAVKQSLTIVERTDFSIARGASDEFELTLKGPRQQRYRLEASTNLTGWSSVAMLTITNVDRTASFRYTPALNAPQLFFRAAAE